MSQVKTSFMAGATKMGLVNKETAEEIFGWIEKSSRYSFNKSHAVSYSIISYQCAWLYAYYPAEWMAAFLDKEPETSKEKAINIAKRFGFKIAPLDINKSGSVWEISEDGKTYTFFLNQNAIWHDKKPVTSYDIEWTFNTILEKGHPSYRSYYSDIKSIEVIDKYTIKFHFKNERSVDI